MEFRGPEPAEARQKVSNVIYAFEMGKAAIRQIERAEAGLKETREHLMNEPSCTLPDGYEIVVRPERRDSYMVIQTLKNDDWIPLTGYGPLENPVNGYDEHGDKFSGRMITLEPEEFRMWVYNSDDTARVLVTDASQIQVRPILQS